MAAKKVGNVNLSEPRKLRARGEASARKNPGADALQSAGSPRSAVIASFVFAVLATFTLSSLYFGALLPLAKNLVAARLAAAGLSEPEFELEIQSLDTIVLRQLSFQAAFGGFSFRAALGQVDVHLGSGPGIRVAGPLRVESIAAHQTSLRILRLPATDNVDEVSDEPVSNDPARRAEALLQRLVPYIENWQFPVALSADGLLIRVPGLPTVSGSAAFVHPRSGRLQLDLNLSLAGTPGPPTGIRLNLEMSPQTDAGSAASWSGTLAFSVDPIRIQSDIFADEAFSTPTVEYSSTITWEPRRKVATSPVLRSLDPDRPAPFGNLSFTGGQLKVAALEANLDMVLEGFVRDYAGVPPLSRREWPVPARFTMYLDVPEVAWSDVLATIPPQLLGPLAAVNVEGSAGFNIDIAIPFDRLLDTAWRGSTKHVSMQLNFIPAEFDVFRFDGPFTHNFGNFVLRIPAPTAADPAYLAQFYERTPASTARLIALQTAVEARPGRQRSPATLPQAERVAESGDLELGDQEQADLAPDDIEDEFLLDSGFGLGDGEGPGTGVGEEDAADNAGDADGSSNRAPASSSEAQSGALRGGSTQSAASTQIRQLEWVTLDRISPWMIQSVLTFEDGNFFLHNGVEWASYRAIVERFLREGEILSGGSTISMQTVKNYFLDQSRQLSRKLQELILVYILESHSPVSKQRILELYLNRAEFGPGLYGIAAASRYYFGKPPASLALHEAVWLASLLPSPGRYSRYLLGDQPTPGWRVRLDFYLEVMVIRGRISQDDFEAARSATYNFSRQFLSDLGR